MPKKQPAQPTIQNIRKDLLFDRYPFSEIPDDFIAFIIFDNPKRTEYYGHRRYNIFKEIGARIYKMIYIDLLVDYEYFEKMTPGGITYANDRLFNREALRCLMFDRDVCFKTDCNEYFGALIGGNYIYIKYELNLPNPLAIIKQWLIDVYPLIVEPGNTQSQCDNNIMTQHPLDEYTSIEMDERLIEERMLAQINDLVSEINDIATINEQLRGKLATKNSSKKKWWKFH